MGGKIGPKTEFNPPLQLGTGEWLFNCEAQNYKMGVFETLF